MRIAIPTVGPASPDGSRTITIEAPKFMNPNPVEVVLTADQYQRYLRWERGDDLIQNLLGDLSPSDREKLMSGLDDAAFAAACGPSDDEPVVPSTPATKE